MTKQKNPVTGKRLTGRDRVAQEIAEFRRDAKLDSWTEFVDELQVSTEMYPAFVTNRPELLRLIKPRALSVEECDMLLKVIGGLMETNAALRLHAQRVAHLTNILDDSLKGFGTAARSINDFANFRVAEEESEEE